MYILKKKFKKKNFKISKSFPKKRKIFKKKKEKKKGLWTRGIEPLSHLKKFFELGALDFLVTFSKKTHFFLSKISRFFKVFFSKWYIRIPWTKLFLNCGV